MIELWFWVATALIVLLSVLIFVLPMFSGKNQDVAASRDQLNKAFYRERMSEIDEESREGLVEDKSELEVELKKSLLDDIPANKDVVQSQGVKLWMLMPGIIVLVGLSYGLYFVEGHSDKVSHWYQVTENLPELSDRLMDSEAEPLSDQEMTDLTLALRTKLQQSPDDATGWLLLGRLGLSNRDMTTALGAMEKAYKLKPNDMTMKLGYAQAMLYTGDETYVSQSRKILREVIGQDHTNTQAYSLLAFEAFGRGAFDEAIDAWSAMKAFLPANDSRHKMLDMSIAQAKARLGITDDTSSVTVTVSLSDEVKVPQNAALIVSVHSADGATMPYAAKRIKASTFPVTVTLTDADNMLEARKMSSLSGIVVRARLDNDGNVTTKKGDWYGESKPTKLGDKSQVSINKRF
ncbi:c-type cytochrome biogenesis protein CcmI [Veronia pacifica]|uniref:C-type cytochrome biogenesis protein CcmI n=1 Tax=Veronia pacifica TaxID=1080227 RepID=A0A1C3EEH1_9GAMM|nr:c-type cytochrome biogenesis protein CcmI [Veronia pacifica]ODA31636.1 c-type cytochrome biogenesis protein CcmI [Veronia pacifica]